MALNAVLSWFIKKRIHQIDLFRKYPVEVQQEWFEKLLKEGRKTNFGLKHDFDKVKSIKDYQSACPIQQYEDIADSVAECMDGKQYEFWSSEIKWFAKSSGTTSSRSKFIPVSKEALENCHYKGGKDLLSIYYNENPNAQLYNGKTLVVGGSSEIIHTSRESYFGDLSAIIIKNLPFWVEIKRTPEREIALMSEWEKKIQVMAEATALENVTNISGVPSWTLILLRRILEITDKKSIHDVWPSLEMYMHGGVNFEPYRKQFEQICSKPLHLIESYNASEGFFGIQDKLGSNELLLMLDYGIFYEFIPLSEYGKDNPIIHTLKEVEKGVQYVIVITTNAGLWRYVPGDTIEFTHLYPFRIKVTGRTKSFINAFGEELIVDNTEKAVQQACLKHNAEVQEYTAAPIYLSEDKGGHEWIIEFDQFPDNLQAFYETLDLELRALNSDYDAKRTGNMALNFPTFHAVNKGTFYAWLKHKKKLGGQNKVPRLANDRKHVEEILMMISKSSATYVSHP